MNRDGAGKTQRILLRLLLAAFIVRLFSISGRGLTSQMHASNVFLGEIVCCQRNK
jgi:hypothetical protein